MPKSKNRSYRSRDFWPSEPNDFCINEFLVILGSFDEPKSIEVNRAGNRDADWGQDRPGNHRAHLRRRATRSPVETSAAHTTDRKATERRGCWRVVSRVVTCRPMLRPVSVCFRKQLAVRNPLTCNAFCVMSSSEWRRRETSLAFVRIRRFQVQLLTDAPVSACPPVCSRLEVAFSAARFFGDVLRAVQSTATARFC